MTAKEGYVRPLPAESEGRAPGRGRLQGRSILVVGGGQRVLDAATDPVGNGRAMSLLFAREGAEVAVADINLPSAEETVAQIVGEGGKGHAIKADISKPDDITAMLQEAEKVLGKIDGLVLNVGIGAGGLGLEGATPEDWDKVLAINLRGPMLCCKAALPKLADGSPVVFISSIAGLIAGSRLPAYDASKAALGGLMRHVALEGSKRGIRANIVAPGLVDTPLGRVATQGRPSRGRTPVPFGRQATGWEIAYAALFLVSDESVYVTAQTLAVDSGLTGIS
ncbi:short-chain dehydrogenase/reductase SDR [Parvibaculum lavamentivorans DS-1]|uniref:Short-chain dehydrogenase/reductase SDR n=1 Tax=Parvibaculum lavamentivorans (strain DS-1 / DSM 13023 / NCIMB 13966) TaxID=402881 RepID=A7HTP3_PARL1|nr:SDR family oxidoreductase [Parvibaculum lavamentivorans]ABS63276.1 short-chain dehydrogenase/reductase SDR [Parvibaculum lavamentivorans DS-1]